MIEPYLAQRFETLQRADENGDLGLIEVQRVSDGKLVVVLAAFERGDMTTIVPLAEMIAGNPFDLYRSPDPDAPGEFIASNAADDGEQFGVFVNGSRRGTFDTRAEASDFMDDMRNAVIQKIDNSELRPELLGCEGWRIEAVDADHRRVRFIVGRSTGWKPCHLEIKRSNSTGGEPVDSRGYTNIRKIEKVR